MAVRSDGIATPYFKGSLPPALGIRSVYTCGSFMYGEVEEALLRTRLPLITRAELEHVLYSSQVVVMLAVVTWGGYGDGGGRW
ncbi:hypothetical protein E2C01_076177 [Portunus trituberculatus]|uniref:Uncharacterized protein n=1 Tax=Portunus trituberculatus TaxID=210409 RepID=A0A5B7IGU4_PORTR|nr:hypothetical protein [Portunus trituberculatus]